MREGCEQNDCFCCFCFWICWKEFVTLDSIMKIKFYTAQLYPRNQPSKAFPHTWLAAIQNLLEWKSLISKDFTSPYSWAMMLVWDTNIMATIFYSFGYTSGSHFFLFVSDEWVFIPEHKRITAVWTKMSWGEMSAATKSPPNLTSLKCLAS